MNKLGRPKKDYYNDALKYEKQKYYSSLSEKSKRHFLGQEYLSLGKGSQRYLAIVFNCSLQTIRKGMLELQSPDFDINFSSPRQRAIGGGRKKKKY